MGPSLWHMWNVAVVMLAPGHVTSAFAGAVIDPDMEDVPEGQKATYDRMVDHRSQKNRIRITVGGDKMKCPYDVSTPMADLVMTKLLINL
eukprot:10713547-Ditylum_brightwellii.AAC.1